MIINGLEYALVPERDFDKVGCYHCAFNNPSTMDCLLSTKKLPEEQRCDTEENKGKIYIFIQ